MSMRYKVIIADVDGTLITPGEYPVKKPSKRLINAVKSAKDRGVLFSLASARSLPWVQTLIDHLEIEAPVILDNGATLFDCKAKKYIFRSDLTKKTVGKIYEFLKDEKDLNIMLAEGENGDRRVDSPSKMITNYANKILIINVSPDKAENIYQKLRKISSVHVTKSVSAVNPVRESIHVTNADATKQLAVGRLAEIMKIKTLEIIGIGDSYNDFSFLMACGLKVAMGNSVKEIKEIADYIGSSYQEDGVARIIEKFILNQ